MDFDGLVGIGDVVPVAVGFPTVDNDLDEDATGGGIGDVGNAFEIRFHVDLGFFVFDQVVLLGFYIDAGVFDGLIVIAACHFDGEARSCGGRRGRFWRSGLLRAHESGRGEENSVRK